MICERAPIDPSSALAPSAEALADLAGRWSRARCSALRAVVAGRDGSEDDLLPIALATDAAQVHHRVFDNSLRLGGGFARLHGVLAFADMPRALGAMRVPCLDGAWRCFDGEEALALARPGCPLGTSGAAACDYWREAIGGLVLGMTGGARHARHESLGRRGERCVDYFYVDPESPLRFGPLPESLGAELERVRRTARAFDGATTVRFLGVSEGVLLYRIDRAGCGGQLDVRAIVERAVKCRFPDLELREISPRSVFDGSPSLDSRADP